MREAGVSAGQAIIDEIRPFIDGNGLVSPRRLKRPGETDTSGNGILYSLEWAITLGEAGGDPNDWEPEYERLVTAVRACQIERGLFKRSPTHNDQEGPDDYVAAGVWFAEGILDYGRTNKAKLWGLIPLRYVYNNVRPGTMLHRDGRTNWSAWLGRFPAVIAHFQFAAGERPPLWRQLFWVIGVACTGLFNPKAQDPWVLSWFLVYVAGDRSWATRWAAGIYRRRLKKHWPGGMRQVLRTYFGFEHPIAKYFPEDRV